MPDPNPEIGQELRRFFIELLEDTNLQEYRSRRVDYIGSRRRDNYGYLSEEAASLLESPALEAIEAHISAVEGSGRATPVWVVCPPM